MGIYLPNMEMPKSCWDCACYHRKADAGYYDYEICGASRTIFNDGYSSVTGHKDHINPFKERLGNCPLVPVPPHGRLIDGDAVVREIESICGTHWTTMEIKRAPTVIQADCTPMVKWRQRNSFLAEGKGYILTPQEEYDGLKRKYVVLKSDNGECVENCFVLRPDKDQAAIAALNEYASATENQVLAADIRKWLSTIIPAEEGET